MRSLLDPSDRAELRARLARLKADTPRRWGRMTAPQMVCHLTDALRGVLAERQPTAAAPPAPLVGRTVIKWLALYAPVAWPRSLPTHPNANQDLGGTPPADFARDVAALVAVDDRFVRDLDRVAQRPHFAFGRLTPAQWARWAYLHMDHHLRQFGL